jgi:hypothetical protein
MTLDVSEGEKDLSSSSEKKCVVDDACSSFHTNNIQINQRVTMCNIKTLNNYIFCKQSDLLTTSEICGVGIDMMRMAALLSVFVIIKLT